MNLLFSNYPVLLIILALVFSLLLMPWMIALAHHLKILDTPAHRKIHRAPVPYLGGAGILLAIVIVYLIDSKLLSPQISSSGASLKTVIAVVLSTMLGLIDDKFQIRARTKLFGQIAIATTFVLTGYHFELLTLPGIQPINLSILGVPLTVFWIVLIINAFNLIDGIDGLCGSATAVIFCSIAAMSHYLLDEPALHLSLISLGAVAGFLYFNWKPARIFLGDAGSHGLGMLVAGLLVSLGHQQSSQSNATQVVEPFLYQMPLTFLVTAYPLLEIGLSVCRRLLKGKPIGSADRGHIHHRLMHIGWNAPQICFAAALISLLGGAVAVSNTAQNKGLSAWLLAIGGLAIGLGAHQLGLFEMFQFSKLRKKRAHFLIANHFISMQKLKIELTESVDQALALIDQTCIELGVHNYSLNISSSGGQPVASFNWERPRNSIGSIVISHPHDVAKPLHAISDSLELPDIYANAQWTFEPIEKEEDIDTEYRVLMSDFMRRFVVHFQTLCESNPQSQSVNSSQANEVTANSIRRRNGMIWKSI